MREMKMKCHELFDRQWKNEKTSKKRHIARKKAYADLAVKLNIPCVIEAQIDEDDKVFPMVPANTAISEAFSAEDLAEKGYDC